MTELDPIRLYVLGDARIETTRAVIEPTATMVFGAGLFFILERAKPVSRGAVAAVLWPNVGRETAAHRLRQTLLKLRKLGLNVASVGRSKLCLQTPATIDCDDIAASTMSVSQMAPFQLSLLAGYDPSFSAEFSQWLESKRMGWSGTLTRVMLTTISQYRLAGEWGSVESCASAMLQLSPLNEEATLALAESYAMRGSKHAATCLLDEYLREVGVGPTDLRVQATIMRRRIAERIAPRTVGTAGDMPLVGRGITMQALGELLRLTRSGSGQAFLMSGDAGIGKSRVLIEFAQFAALQGFATQRIQCRAGHKQRPLAAFVELAPALRTLPGAIGCSPETLTFLDRLTTHQPRREDRLNDAGDQAWIFSGVQRALFDLIDAVAHEAPLLIQVEDTHWLDAESAELMREMIGWAHNRRVLFAFTCREAPDEWQFNVPLRLHSTHLGPLSPDDASNLVLNILRRHGRTMTDSYLKWCVSAAEGNPYFLSELANHWIETGAEHQVPPSLSAVLRQRVCRLDSDALQLLQTCALLENNSTLERIEAVLEHDAHNLLRSINALGSADMIVADLADGATSTGDLFASKHELLSNVALTQLSTPARRFLHRRIAQVLEAEIGERFLARTLWDCAKHWQLAGDSRRAWNVATSCASHLMELGLATASAEAYTRCLAFCTTDEQRLEILTAQTSAYYSMSAWTSVREGAMAVRALRQRLSPGAFVHDEIELMDLRAEWQSLEWDIVLKKARKCLDSIDAPPGHRAEAGVMVLMLLGFEGNCPDLGDAYERIEHLSSCSEVRAATKLQARMVYHTNVGDLGKGVVAARQLVAEQQTNGNIGDQFRAHCNAGVTFRVAGLFAEAEASFAEALSIAESHGLQPALERVLPLIANMALEIGDIEVAKTCLLRLESLPLDPSNALSILESRGIAVRLALHCGNGVEASSILPMTYAAACIDPIHHRRTYNLALHAAVQLAIKGQASSECLRALRESFEASKAGVHQAYAASVLCVCLRRSGAKNKAESTLAEYCKSRREPWPFPTHLLDALERSCPAC
jgi:DNA-binding SARP family transcriptional activator/tetratricopeptide (TPR) repeat protein